MSGKHLHIISFIVPYPVDYGGVYDIFYKIVALHKAGVKIILHCFTEHNRQQPELEKYCENIFYYPRKTGLSRISFTLPYIVSSRMDHELLARLMADNHPVLAEGIHTTGWLLKYRPPDRKILLRLHNVEHHYYHQLFKTSTSAIRKIYYLAEAILLKRWERKIANIPHHILAVSHSDATIYQDRFHVKNVSILPVFTGFSFAGPQRGTGSYALYHGNLAVDENEVAVTWLLEHVFKDGSIPFVVAGKNPSLHLKKLFEHHPHTTLVENPSQPEMQRLIAAAQCNVLPSFNVTGIKLKLINALFHGRRCIVNDAAVSGSGLESICSIANTPQAFKESVHAAMLRPMSADESDKRRSVLQSVFDDDANAEKLSRLIW